MGEKMKSKYLNNLIEDSLFTRMKSGVTKVGLVALVGTMITVGVYGCKSPKTITIGGMPISRKAKMTSQSQTSPRLLR